MAAVLGDVLRLTDRQTLLGQQVLNVYFFRVTSITGLASNYLEVFCTWFDEHVVDPVTATQHQELAHVELYAENISNGVDIFTFTDGYPKDGLIGAGEVMPPFVSWGIQLIRESRVTRNGYKRIGGVSEGAVSDGVIEASYAGVVATAAEAMDDDWVDGIITLAEPIILKRPFVVPLITYEYSSIGDAVYKAVGTQNTRKFGRGV